jgi:hypothetical protein
LEKINSGYLDFFKEPSWVQCKDHWYFWQGFCEVSRGLFVGAWANIEIEITNYNYFV